MFSHLNNYILDESLATEARTKKNTTMRINYKFLCNSRMNLIFSCGHFTLHFITLNISSVYVLLLDGQMMRNKRERKIISNSAIYQNFVSHRVNALYRIHIHVEADYIVLLYGWLLITNNWYEAHSVPPPSRSLSLLINPICRLVLN